MSSAQGEAPKLTTRDIFPCGHLKDFWENQRFSQYNFRLPVSFNEETEKDLVEFRFISNLKFNPLRGSSLVRLGVQKIEKSLMNLKAANMETLR